ncbi:thioredoxin [Aestuariimicrobium sp. p3-SID1156]|uniref:thioredoxin n=1 Tax=Aestuariimicrobium sp. p3-SID1156 TaxID=2916038 RepID=UPI00223BAD29|nr:thioredoxin [Aestuariimicrobium sp. p3-SID1156]MCT1458456.1 thioredoxin [Aestuariimicrobium sp. p3-SID1156]
MGGKTVELTAQNFAETVEANDIVLVDFWAGWCGPCMRFAPIYEAASDRHSDVTFAKLDTEAERDVAAGMEISSIPTVMAFKQGALVYREAGLLNAGQLDKLIEQLKELDVDKLKAEAQGQPQG